MTSMETEEARDAWLANLAAGDQVIVEPSNGGMNSASLATVHRVTKTQIVLRNKRGIETKFNRKRGREGGTWHWSMLEQPTPERVLKIRARAAKFRLVQHIDNMSDQQVVDLHEYILGMRAMEPVPSE